MYRTIISAQELNTLIHSGTPPVVVDCRFDLLETERGLQSYRVEHIPGAYYAHLDCDLASPHIPGKTGRHPLPDPDDFCELMSGFGVNKDSQVIAYDDEGGAIAARLWGLLRYCGHGSVAILDGGFPAWLDAGFETSDSIPPRKHGDFECNIQSQMVVSSDFMRKNHSDPKYRVVDSRTEERYLGVIEPIDPIPGRIPNSLNYPHPGILDESMKLKSVDELKKRFEPLFNNVHPENVIVYCGSGVTSILNQIAMEYAGFGEVKVYIGSWSEWITDPDAPIATGEVKA